MSDFSATYIYPLTLLRGRPAAPDEDAGSGLELALESHYRLPDGGAGELLLVRHAEPAAAAETAPLSVTGRVQAHLLAGRLADGWVEAVYCAPERYAVETARFISQELDRPYAAVTDLRDIAVTPGVEALLTGLADGETWDSIGCMEGSYLFRRRVERAIGMLQSVHESRRIVVVTHASVINAYLAGVLGVDRDLFFHPDYASISTLRWLDDRRRLQSLNETAHLTGAGSHWFGKP